MSDGVDEGSAAMRGSVAGEPTLTDGERYIFEAALDWLHIGITQLECDRLSAAIRSVLERTK